MESREEAKALIQQYTEEIESMKNELNQARMMLNNAKETKRSLRPSARGRIADNDWNTKLVMAQCDCEIARYEAEVALYRNQIKARKEEIARLKKIK